MTMNSNTRISPLLCAIYVMIAMSINASMEHNSSYDLPSRSNGRTYPLFIFIDQNPKDTVFARKFLRAMASNIDSPILINRNLLRHALSILHKNGNVAKTWSPHKSAFFTIGSSHQSAQNSYILVFPRDHVATRFQQYDLEYERMNNISSQIYKGRLSPQHNDDGAVGQLIDFIAPKKRSDQSLQWIIEISGHGSTDGDIAGMEPGELQQFLHQIETRIWTRALIISSCFTDGTSISHTIRQLQNNCLLQYPIISKTTHNVPLFEWSDYRHMQYAKFVYAIRNRCLSLAHLLSFVTEQGTVHDVARFSYPQIITPGATNSKIIFPYIDITATPEDRDRKITLSSQQFFSDLQNWRSEELRRLKNRTIFYNDRMHVKLSSDYIPHVLDISDCNPATTAFIFNTQRTTPYVFEKLVTKQKKLSDILQMFWTHGKGEFDASTKILIKTLVRNLPKGTRQLHVVTVQKSPTSNAIHIIYKDLHNRLYSLEHGQQHPKPHVNAPDYEHSWHTAYTAAQS